MIDVAKTVTGLNPAERIELMEALWSEMARNGDTLQSPAWHEKELARRNEAVLKGEQKAVDWNQAKKLIRRRVG